MQFVIISGMSGAGKSRAASDLEDLGFYCVDNMPAEMIPQFAQLCLATKGRYEKVALVTDIRASMTFDALFQALQKLDDMHLQYSIYYIEASTAVIIKRYKETRRLHPLMKDGSTLENAIARERELLAPPSPTVPAASSTRPISLLASCADSSSIWSRAECGSIRWTCASRPRLQIRSPLEAVWSSTCGSAEPVLYPGAEAPDRAGRTGQKLRVQIPADAGFCDKNRGSAFLPAAQLSGRGQNRSRDRRRLHRRQASERLYREGAV